MLNLATPTIEIKTSGTNLSDIETLYVTIKQGNLEIIKSNDNIEIDNDVVCVFLTQEESLQLKESGGTRVEIMAVGYDGQVSIVKTKWTKPGSRTGNTSTGGGKEEPPSNNVLWYPIISESGIITWEKSDTETPPTPKDIKGKDGFSPTITENPQNNNSTYKLDITTKTGTFTTPNLKGKDGTSPDINLSDYYTKEETYSKEEVNELIAEIGGGLEIKKWIVTANGGYEYDESNAIYSISNSSTERITLALSIYVPAGVNILAPYNFGYYGCGSVSLNGKSIFSKTSSTSNNQSGNLTLNLTEGANNLVIITYSNSSSYEATRSVTLPPIGV